MAAVPSSAGDRPDSTRRIDTGFATVRLADALGDSEASRTLQSFGLEIVDRIEFRKHLYLLRHRSNATADEVVQQLMTHSHVTYAEPHVVEPLPKRSQPSISDECWRLARIEAAGAWRRSRGRGATVAVIDHGFHLWLSDFAGSLAPAAGFFRRTSPETSAFSFSVTDMPEDFHGTFCAAIAIGRANERAQVCGVAPEAAFLPVACEHDEMSSQLTLARALAHAATPRDVHGRPQRGADVVSCSLGPPRMALSSVLRDGLEYVKEAGRGGLGTPVFWSVTNEELPLSTDAVNSSGLTVPVGRSDEQDQRAPGAIGPELAFLAPGESVVSVLQDGRAAMSSGTSFAAPCAAGIAALMLAIDASLPADAVVDLMQETCDPVRGVPHRPHPTSGYGRVNARRAVDLVARRAAARSK